jgi:hypothetical protein
VAVAAQGAGPVARAATEGAEPVAAVAPDVGLAAVAPDVGVAVVAPDVVAVAAVPQVRWTVAARSARHSPAVGAVLVWRSAVSPVCRAVPPPRRRQARVPG